MTYWKIFLPLVALLGGGVLGGIVFFMLSDWVFRQYGGTGCLIEAAVLSLIAIAAASWAIWKNQ